MGDKSDIKKQLLETFKAELDDHLKTLTEGFLSLEKGDFQESGAENILSELYRSAHSLKGAARAVNIGDIERLAHKLEDILGAFKERKIELNPDIFDVLFKTIDSIRDAMEEHLKGGSLPQETLNKLLSALDEVKEGRKGDFTLPKRKEADIQDIKAHGFIQEDSVVKVSIEKLDSIMNGVGELLTANMRIGQVKENLFGLKKELSSWKKNWIKTRQYLRDYQTKENIPKELIEIFDFLEQNQTNIEENFRKVNSIIKEFTQNINYLNFIIQDLNLRARELRMAPISTLFDAFPRAVRDMARMFGKDVDLKIEGGEIEIDRKVMDLLRDPIIHLLRNAIDHGIESPDVRKSLKKSETGTILLRAQARGNSIVIEISDDGAGIDIEKIKSTGVKKGLFTEKDDVRDVMDLIFYSGLSTKDKVTELSGRGIGLDVVKSNLEAIQGMVSVESEKGVGTSFYLSVPVSLSTTMILKLKCGGEIFGIPINNIERVLKIQPGSIGSIEGRAVVIINDRPIIMSSLAQALSIPHTIPDEDILIVILCSAERRGAFQVDNLLGTDEVIVKNFGFPIKRAKNLSGGCIMGDGGIVPVLNVSDLLKSTSFRPHMIVPEERKKEQKVKKRVLVADDSITTRTLVKTILEHEGYNVIVSSDGEKAWNLIKTEPLDVVVSDILMPKIDGFELTKRIKKDDKLKDIPVILVTSLESTEDKVRGMEAGADAYIKKSAFDQRKLIEAIEELT